MQVDSEGSSAIMKGVRSGDILVVNTLLEHKPNLKQIDSHSYTPLLQAIFDENVTMVETLLQHGSNPNFEIGMWKSPLEMACACARCPKIVKLLIERGADVNYVNSRNMSAIGATVVNIGCTEDTEEIAATYETVKILFLANADIRLVNANGSTILDLSLDPLQQNMDNEKEKIYLLLYAAGSEISEHWLNDDDIQVPAVIRQDQEPLLSLFVFITCFYLHKLQFLSCILYNLIK